MHENGGARVNQPLSPRKGNFHLPGQALGKQSGGSPPPPSASIGVVVPAIRKSVTKMSLIMVFFMFLLLLESVGFSREKPPYGA
jgi:hypothetical protein